MNTFSGEVPDMIEWINSFFNHAKSNPKHDVDLSEVIEIDQNLYKKVHGEMRQFKSEYYRCKNCGLLISGKKWINRTCEEDKRLLNRSNVGEYMDDESYQILKEGRYNNAALLTNNV